MTLKMKKSEGTTDSSEIQRIIIEYIENFQRTGKFRRNRYISRYIQLTKIKSGR